MTEAKTCPKCSTDQPCDCKVMRCITAELDFARTHFPGNRHMLAALMEEVGELANALMEHRDKTAADVYAEAVQVAAMAIRIANEGSAEFPYTWDEYHHKIFLAKRVPDYDWE